jgi:hypothetical protein
MVGAEFQWIRRENNDEGPDSAGFGFESEDYRVQFSARYNFSHGVQRN